MYYAYVLQRKNMLPMSHVNFCIMKRITRKNEQDKENGSLNIMVALGGHSKKALRLRACLQTRFCLRGSGFLRRDEGVDDETYREYVESELRVAIKNPL